ncbi:MAG: ATP-binding protein [Phenylobacterium sp.]
MGKPEFRFLDRGLDEMAAGTRAGFPPRLAATIAVGLVSLSFLPWPVCLAWAVAVVGFDGASWFASREQYLGLPVRLRSRLGHVFGLVGGVTGWVGLGVLLWASGGPAGAMCAMVIWLAVMGFAQVHAYQSRAGYLLSGVIPAAAAVITPLVAPNHSFAHAWPVWFIILSSVAFSITGARQTMAARRRYEKATDDLRESELSYRLLADNVTDVISLASADNERLYVSPSIERILGYAPGELLAEPNYKYLHPDDSQAVQAFIQAVTVESGPQTLEYRVLAKDGATVWAETTFQRLADGSGRVLGASRDVTGRKTLETELKEAVTRAEAAAAAKTDFLANMTHELRTPLTAILGFAGVLKGSKSLTKRDARHAGLIHDASQTLLGVVGDVLDFSKLEAGAFDLETEPFDPAAMVRSTAAIVEQQAAEKALTLSIETDAAAPALIGDAPRLRQVVLNFLSNAIKFTREGEVAVALSHQPAGDRSRLRVEVRDTGIGIDAEQMDSLFTRFAQADVSVSRRFGGTGLGLAISKQLIEAMGGRIGADSAVGEGSTFWFEVELPLAGEWTATPEGEMPGPALARPIRALVVEDNAVNRELIITLLSPFEIEIDTACDGAEALEAVARRSYDVILMDMQMPVMDGLTATRRIRAMADRDTAATPIIAMTANVLPEQVARCREAGMDDHLGKPINLPQLLSTLARWSAPGDEGARREAGAAGR